MTPPLYDYLLANVREHPVRQLLPSLALVLVCFDRIAAVRFILDCFRFSGSSARRRLP
jgi:hypothetical protein